MTHLTCIYIKKDGTVYENKCWLPIGCYKYSKLYEKNIKKIPCLINDCAYRTDSSTKYYSNHLDRIYLLNYQIKKKYRVKTF